MKKITLLSRKQSPDLKNAETPMAPLLSDKPQSKWRSFWNEYGYLGFAFLIPVVLMFLLYVAMELHPFGDGSVLVLDLNAQYAFFYEALRAWVWGDGSLLYSFGRSLGGEFMGIYAYYIASPFSYIVALFPRDRMLEALLTIFLLKAGCCGATFGFYLHKTAAKKNKLSAWDKVMISRGKDRPVAEDYIKSLFPDFVEFHGDRFVKDDQAIMGGIATFAGRAVTVIAESKGHDTKQNVERNFGMPSPDGYRKALRLMRQAEKFGRPVICLIDTPGAYCGLEAEERGQGEAIARNLYELSSLKVPVLSIIISEAGSGGALALGVSDKVWMLENAIYAILSPEGYASILWKDSKRAPEAAAEMKLTAEDMLELGIVEKVISEPEDLTQANLSEVTEQIASDLAKFIKDNLEFDGEALIEARYERYRKYGA